jgi:hypothetical protein
MSILWVVRLESLGMYGNFSYMIALHYIWENLFHPLKPHVTTPLFFLAVKTPLEEIFCRFELRQDWTRHAILILWVFLILCSKKFYESNMPSKICTIPNFICNSRSPVLNNWLEMPAVVQSSHGLPVLRWKLSRDGESVLISKSRACRLQKLHMMYLHVCTKLNVQVH